MISFFLSGDTATAFLLACFLSHGTLVTIKTLLFVYVSLIAYGRIYMGAHFPIDMLFGLSSVFSAVNYLPGR